MFSYLQSVKEIVSEDIYQLGLREYLLGNVLEYISMDVRDWRQYQVRGREIYTVTIPLLHLLTTKSQWIRGGDNLNKLIKCTCEYFQTIGACKHCIAVCASLDREIKPASKEQEINRTTPTLGKLLDFEEQKDVTYWMQEVEYFFELTAEDDPQNISLRKVYEAFRTAFTSQHVDLFLERLIQYSNEHSTERNFQKRILTLALFTRLWLVGGHQFWKWILPLIEHLDPTLKHQFWLDLYKEWQFFAPSLAEHAELVEEAAHLLDTTEKKKILRELEEQGFKLVDQLGFAIFSGETEFVLDHLSAMDAKQLIALMPNMVDHLGDIEYYIGEQMSMFANFLNAQNESQLLSYLRAWKNAAPDSSQLQKTIEQIKEVHKKRKKLLRELKFL
jgi:hypothetical protein